MITQNEINNVLRSAGRGGYKIARASYLTKPKVAAGKPEVVSYTEAVVGIGLNYQNHLKRQGEEREPESNWFEEFDKQNYVVRHRKDASRKYLRFTTLRPLKRSFFQKVGNRLVEISKDEYEACLIPSARTPKNGKPPIKVVPLDQLRELKYGKAQVVA